MPISEGDPIWLNSELVPRPEAKAHAFTHVLHYGSAVFGGIRCYQPVRGPRVSGLTDLQYCSAGPKFEPLVRRRNALV